ncbi:MAG: poly-beta-1,6-N-acetyl-D-glucosamine N-deacetylase PgaB [Chromatiales bacterium]|nr:poly-beta-1,6-N-acetyl-D-glucosamine N-deacetylase PgaB [Chromatiales bacterium]
MRTALRLAALSFLLFTLSNALRAEENQQNNEFFVLSYHDVQDDASHERLGDAVTIGTDELVAQFAWLRENHYTMINLEDIRAARAGTRSLPPNAVLLTFDDSYVSFYTRVFPLLKLFNYPAVVAPVVSWLEQPEGSAVAYGDTPVPRSSFMSWGQVRELIASGLVEIASHSYELHNGVPGNPQGNLQPAATTRAWDAARGVYEDDATYFERVRADLERSARIIAQRTGQRPRAIVWPYGRYNQAVNKIADDLGMTLSFDLSEHGRNDVRNQGIIHRAFITHGATLQSLVDAFNTPDRPPVTRAMQVDLDYVYDPDPAQQEHNLSLLLERVRALGVDTVYLQAYADPDGDGNADALYFPNRHLPMRADLFNRVAWQLATRTHTNVYAWLPVLAYTPPPGHPLRDQVVRAEAGEQDPARYPRLSPFSAEARDFVGDIYEDLARHSYIAGILFHDDALLAEDEDASPLALAIYTMEWDLPASIDAIRANPAALASWTRHKTELLAEWTDTLAARVRVYQPDIKTARNLYAPIVLDPGAEERFAQSLPVALERYDYAAVMAMPFMENQSRPNAWLTQLATRIAQYPNGLERTVFALQTVDWRTSKRVDTAVLRAQLTLLQRLGARHLAYYPDDFIADHPNISALGAVMSTSTFPYPE